MDETLSEKISNSGYKFNFIADQLGISYMALNNKLSGKSDFRVSEVRKLSVLLNLSAEEKQKFFGI